MERRAFRALLQFAWKLLGTFDEERAKEIAKWLKDHQEEVYLDKLLEEGLSHEEAWEIASKTTSLGVSIEELTEA